ncbi:DUF4124 domain-containing protein [Porticoccaceae bacterium]|nr:DUF4124 domain-containing protein [Porticoccaceae bacterium]MDC0010156.1 DUF4124 domain-containing protein [Porticoccaceae bacterium]
MKSLLSPFTAIATTLGIALVMALLLNRAAASDPAAPVYKVVDDQGNVTYTDTPAAETATNEIVLPAINPISSPIPASISSTAESPDPLDAEPAKAFAGYSSVALAAPLDGSLVHFDQPNLLVQLALTPQLEADHLVQFYVDGSAYGKAIPGISLSIGGLERGSHRISARVLSSQGAVLAITNPVTVHVQRHFKCN